MYETASGLTRTWAEAVLRQLKLVKEKRDVWHYYSVELDMGGEWCLPAIRATFRELWSAEHALVWMAYQMQKWVTRLGQEAAGDPHRSYIAEKLDTSEDGLLRDLRNALEHLNEAHFADSRAVPPAIKGKRSWSLKRLPKQSLWIALGHHKLFGLIDLDVLEQRARAILKVLDAEIGPWEQRIVESTL